MHAILAYHKETVFAVMLVWIYMHVRLNTCKILIILVVGRLMTLILSHFNMYVNQIRVASPMAEVIVKWHVR